MLMLISHFKSDVNKNITSDKPKQDKTEIVNIG